MSSTVSTSPVFTVFAATAAIVFMMAFSACAAPENTVSNPKKSVSASEKSLQASLLTFDFKTDENLSKDNLRDRIVTTLKAKSISFGTFKDAYAAFPRLKMSGDPLLNIDVYEFSNPKKSVVMSGKVRDEAFDTDSDLNTFIANLQNLLPDFNFQSHSENKKFTITAAYKSPLPTPKFNDEISEIKKQLLQKAVPDERTEGPFLQSLADLSKNMGLYLKWVKENKPELPDNSGISRFQITVHEEGFLKDLFGFMAEVSRLSRTVYFVSAKIEKTEARSGVELGRGEFVLETYYVE